MRVFIFLFIFMTVLMVLVLTSPTKISEDIVTNEEIIEYKNSILASCSANGYNISNEMLNNLVERYAQSSTPERKLKGMEVGKALKIALITSAVFFGIIFIRYWLINAHYDELYGESTNGLMGRLRRFFFGKWF